jgi:hypothetical protein
MEKYSNDPLSLPNVLRGLFGIAIAIALINDRLSIAAWLLGLGTIGGAIALFVKPRLPYGWEGRAPSGYIEGTPARIVAIIFGLMGIAILFLGADFLEALLTHR